MIKVNVFSEENSWSKKIRKKEKLFNQICDYFPKKFKFFKKRVYFTLLLSNNKKIKILNKKTFTFSVDLFLSTGHYSGCSIRWTFAEATLSMIS